MPSVVQSDLMQPLGSRFNGNRPHGMEASKKERIAIFTLCFSSGGMADDPMRRKFVVYKGSYTVEAAAVMGIFCFLIVSLIQEIYQMRDITVGMMALHEAVEKADSGGEDREVDENGKEISLGNFRIFLEEDGEVISGTVEAGIRKKAWKGQIETEIFRPERFIRRAEAVRQLGDRDGS